MQNKLQELTDKLYQEGLAKGKQEADTLLAEAKSKAEEIVAAARAEAAKIVADAQKQAADTKAKAEGDIKIASTQTLSGLKQKISEMVQAKVVNGAAKNALSDQNFVAELIKTVVAAFKPEEGVKALDVILPASMKSQLEGTLAGKIGAELSKGLEFNFSDAVDGGFRIAPKGEGYFIDFSDESFSSLIGEYLRPAAKKILFG